MDPITVTWNGPTTVEQAVETPDVTATCGEFAQAFADARGIDGDLELVWDGESVPADAPVDLLSGAQVALRVLAPVDNEADLPAAVVTVTTPQGAVTQYAQSQQIP